MQKIKIIQYSKTVGFSGTDRAAQLFCKYLSKSERYEPYLLYRDGDPANTRLDIMKNILGEDHVISHKWVSGKKGRQAPYLPEEDNYFDVVSKINPAIVHDHYSGYNEWPVFKYLAPNAKLIGHNIFGFKEDKKECDAVIYISQFIHDTAIKVGGIDGPVLYNPIEMPVLDMTPDNKTLCRTLLLDEYKLPRNAILLGRVGRADNFDPISLKAFKEIELKYPNAYYLIVNPCNGWRDTVKNLNIHNIRFIDPIIDDNRLSNFYRGLDIYAHARSDGECCPTNIQEAMMHGVPVVSHESAIYNGQSEIIENAGFVVPLGNWQGYRDVLSGLIENNELATEDEKGKVRIRDHFGREGRRRAMRCFEASCVTSQLSKIYDWVLK